MIFSIFSLFLILIAVPYFAGELLVRNEDSRLIQFVYGYFVLWTTMFGISVFAVLMKKDLDFVVLAYLVVCAVVLIAGVFLCVLRRGSRQSGAYNKLSKNEFIFITVFLGIVLFQIYKTVFFAYADGDDAFYVTTSQDMVATGLLYKTNPYVGEHVTNAWVNYRYALSPLPVWIAMIANVSKFQVTVISYILVAPLFIMLTYVIYNETARIIYNDDREKRYLLLMFLAFFAMFSNVSTQTPETFMLTRARQGKEALANIIIPFVFMLIARLTMSDDDEHKLKIGFRDVLLFLIAAFSASLMSVFGNILMLIMLFVLFLYILLLKRKIKVAMVVAFLALPSLVIAGLYIYLG